MPSCIAQQSSAIYHAAAQIINPAGNTVATRIIAPAGYARVAAPAMSYTAYLRNLPLQPHGSMVRYYNGTEKANPGVYAAVLKMDIGNTDLQQCADAVMRLRAEYLYAAGRFQDIRFKFTSGFIADYIHWQQGYRVAFAGRGASWVKRAPPSGDYNSFRKYLDLVFTYAGTRSLAKELKTVPFKDMQVGDVLIVGGSPGHAVTVMDMAQNAAGEKVYLLSQSYMPAQDIQILCNPENPAMSPWYKLNPSAGMIHTPQWDFTTADLKRF